MTCLTVKSSIQPINRPTGTDDDMGGNNKADALAGSDLERTGITRRSAQLPQKPGQIDPALTFYDISRAGLHLCGTGKRPGVAERR